MGDFLDWKYVGPIFETALNQSWSIWSGSTSILSLLSSPESIFSLPIRSSLFSRFERCAAETNADDSTAIDYGINFETASVMRLNNAGDSLDDGTSTTAVDFLSFGTERGDSPPQSLPAPLEFRFSIPRHFGISSLGGFRFSTID